MTDQAIGFTILGIGMLVVLAVVFVIASRGGPSGARPTPPRGVHLPPPSYLPAIFSAAAALIGAGLAFRTENELANPWLAIPGLVLFVVTAIAWVRAANGEWRETEHGAHHDEPPH